MSVPDGSLADKEEVCMSVALNWLGGRLVLLNGLLK